MLRKPLLGFLIVFFTLFGFNVTRIPIICVKNFTHCQKINGQKQRLQYYFYINSFAKNLAPIVLYIYVNKYKAYVLSYYA